MIRVTKLTDYGIVLMTRLARQDEQLQITAPDLSQDIGLPLPTVRKLLKILTMQNLLISTRGVSGGYRLARTPEKITLMDMVEALEGRVALTECSSDEPCACKLDNCSLGKNWSLINRLLQNTLESYNLAEMAGSLAALPPRMVQFNTTSDRRGIMPNGISNQRLK